MGLKLFYLLDNLERYLCQLLLTAVVGLLFAQIVARQLFDHAFSWSEELAVYLFVWFVFLGASYATRRAAHNRISFHYRWLPKPVAYWLPLLADLIWLAFNSYFIYLSIEFISLLKPFFRSPTLGVEMRYLYLILPFAFTLMSLRLIQVNYLRYRCGLDVSQPSWQPPVEADSPHPTPGSHR